MKGAKMTENRIKKIILSGGVHFVQAKTREEIGELTKKIQAFSNYYHRRASVQTGIWANSYTMESFPLLKIEVETLPGAEEKDKERVKPSKKMKKILTMIDKGMTISEIARFFGCSRQNIHGLIKSYKRKEKKICEN